MQQCTNGYIQIISFQTGSCNFLLSVADEILIIPIRVSLSQVRRLNATVAICRRYSLSEDNALLVYTLKARANGRNKSQHCCVFWGFFWPTMLRPFAGPKSLSGFKLYATITSKCQHCCGSMQTDATCWAQ